MLNIANVAMPAWQAIFLILLSFGSLGIALYCLLFMVPLKKFVQRIESLGGGMDGIKRHLDGVEAYFEKELQQIRSSGAGAIDEVRTENKQRLVDVEKKMHDVADAVARLRSGREELEKSIHTANKGLAESKAGWEEIEARLRELQHDISVMAEETEGKLQRQVKESFYELEATVLATLEVLRDELLPAEEKSDSRGRTHRSSFKSGGKSAHRREDEVRDSKIISAGPLFSQPPPPGEEDDDGGED